MIFGQSVKSVLRTPLKTILFIVLIASVTAFACLGFGMLSSGNRLIKAADETYTTKAVIEYIDEGYPDSGRYTDTMIEQLSAFDRSVLSDNENVLSFEPRYEVGGYLEGYRALVVMNKYGKYGVLRFRFRGDTEFGQAIMIQEAYYNGDTTFREGNILYIPADQDLGLIEGHVYIAHGKFSVGYMHTDAFTVTAYVNSHAPNDRFFERPIWDITDLMENDAYEQEEKYSLFMNVIESYDAMNNYISVEPTRDAAFATPFLLQQTNLLDDGVSRFFTEEEYENSERVIILSDAVLKALGKSVGDTVRLGLYVVASDGSFAKNSFWPETDYSERGEYKVVGVYKVTDQLKNHAYIPVPKGAESWLPDNAISYTVGNVVLKNGTAEEYLEDIKPYLLEDMRVSVYDQGYSETIAPLLAIRETAFLLAAVSVICCLVVLILFAYIFVAKQKDTASTMVALGAGKRRALAYLLISVLIIAVIASSIGAVVGFRLSERVTEAAYERAERTVVVDNSFSAVYMGGDEVEFVRDFKPDVWPIALTAAAVVLAALIISLIVSTSAVKRSAPKAKGPNTGFFERIAYSFGLAFKSIFRGGAKNIVVPIVSFVLLLFIGLFAWQIATSSEKLDDIYDNSTIYGYCTTYRGKRLDRLTLRDEDIVDLVNDSHVEEVYCSCSRLFDQLRYKKAGSEVWRYCEAMDSVSHDIDDYGFANPSVAYDKVFFTESIAHTPEFLFHNCEVDITYLDGYSDECFKGSEPVCAMPSAFMQDHGLELGDEIQLRAYSEFETGAVDLFLTVKIVASFEQVAAKARIYVPLSLSITEYYTYTAWSVYDGMLYGFPGKLPADTPQEELDKHSDLEYVYDKPAYNAIAFKLKDLRTLSEFKKSLLDHGYSTVDGAGKLRIWVVLEDTFMNKSIVNLNRHISYMTILFIVAYLLAVAIGFVLSYLLTKNRKSELAMMRSMGTGMIRTFNIFFLEQLILSLIGGALGILAVWLIYGKIIKLQWLGFAGYFICYWIGVAISTIIMNRVDVIKLLSAKD